MASRPGVARLRELALGFPPNLRRRLVLSEPDVDRVTQEAVRSPGEIGDLGDKLRLDPMDAGQDERRAEARAARRWDAQRRCLARQRIEAAPEIGENFDGHPCAHTAGVNELAVVGVIAE